MRPCRPAAWEQERWRCHRSLLARAMPVLSWAMYQAFCAGALHGGRCRRAGVPARDFFLPLASIVVGLASRRACNGAVSVIKVSGQRGSELERVNLLQCGARELRLTQQFIGFTDTIHLLPGGCHQLCALILNHLRAHAARHCGYADQDSDRSPIPARCDPRSERRRANARKWEEQSQDRHEPGARDRPWRPAGD